MREKETPTERYLRLNEEWGYAAAAAEAAYAAHAVAADAAYAAVDAYKRGQARWQKEHAEGGP